MRVLLTLFLGRARTCFSWNEGAHISTSCRIILRTKMPTFISAISDPCLMFWAIPFQFTTFIAFIVFVPIFWDWCASSSPRSCALWDCTSSYCTAIDFWALRSAWDRWRCRDSLCSWNRWWICHRSRLCRVRWVRTWIRRSANRSNPHQFLSDILSGSSRECLSCYCRTRPIEGDTQYLYLEWKIEN